MPAQCRAEVIPPLRVGRIPAGEVESPYATRAFRMSAPQRVTRAPTFHAVRIGWSGEGQEVLVARLASCARASNTSNSAAVTSRAGLALRGPVVRARPDVGELAPATHDPQGLIAVHPSEAPAAHIAQDSQSVTSVGASGGIGRVGLPCVGPITHTLWSNHRYDRHR